MNIDILSATSGEILPLRFAQGFGSRAQDDNSGVGW